LRRARSTPLTLAAAENRAFIHHTHFDERGLGHLALGLAKASGQPVAVIVTSGTATANLYPALIEAGLTGEKLILLTADRPPELIDCGANQAIRQPGMFASHPSQTLSLPRPSQDIPPAGWSRPSTRRSARCTRRRSYQLPVCRTAVWRYGRHRRRVAAAARRLVAER
jgi:2-succinyl-5-enolpyruvyl-6-hydroxy-3-cyclohexene-1-carboxylate synthase